MAERLARESPVSPADVHAVIRALPTVMAEIMAESRSVNLEGLGSFHFTAQATDKSVNLATPGLFAAMPDAATMAGKTPEEVETYIKTIGLYRNKSKHAVGIAKALRARFGGQEPDNNEELVSLPGGGRKTAKAVRNVAFGKPYIPVDTHIFRVCARTSLVKAKTADECSDKLETALPKEYLGNAHHWI